MNNSLSPIQNKLLELMDWYHNYCVENHLTYYMIGGTMLGAIRHKGFIPWDDDIDVGMPRPDFERFLELTEGKIINGYTSESFLSGNDDYVYPFAKVYDTSTTLVEKKRVPVVRGVYLDVFPLDGVGSGKKYARRYQVFRFEKNVLSVITADIEKGRPLKKNIVIGAAKIIPFHKTLSRKLLANIDTFCKRVPYKKAKYVANLNGSRKNREFLRKDIFGTPQIYEFENLKLYGVEKYDEYLSTLIGDYMTLPPENKRFGHFNGKCDLQHGYKNT